MHIKIRIKMLVFEKNEHTSLYNRHMSFSYDWQTKALFVCFISSTLFLPHYLSPTLFLVSPLAHSSKQSCTQILKAIMHYIVWCYHLNI